jgi:hypothetical protein
MMARRMIPTGLSFSMARCKAKPRNAGDRTVRAALQK